MPPKTERILLSCSMSVLPGNIGPDPAHDIGPVANPGLLPRDILSRLKRIGRCKHCPAYNWLMQSLPGRLAARSYYVTSTHPKAQRGRSRLPICQLQDRSAAHYITILVHGTIGTQLLASNCPRLCASVHVQSLPASICPGRRGAGLQA